MLYCYVFKAVEVTDPNRFNFVPGQIYYASSSSPVLSSVIIYDKNGFKQHTGLQRVYLCDNRFVVDNIVRFLGATFEFLGSKEVEDAFDFVNGTHDLLSVLSDEDLVYYNSLINDDILCRESIVALGSLRNKYSDKMKLNLLEEVQNE